VGLDKFGLRNSEYAGIVSLGDRIGHPGLTPLGDMVFPRLHSLAEFRLAGSRFVRSLSLVFVGLGCTTAAAQPSPYLAEVLAPEVAIRSGPGDQMPETGSLARGARLIVDHEEGGLWLAVQPPRGQVSWVKHLFLKLPAPNAPDGIAYNAVVQSEGEVEVAAGRPGFGKPLDVRRTRIPDQTIVLVIGKKVEHGGSFWYPIEPPDGDFRYVPKSAVRSIPGQAVASFVVRDPQPGSVPPESRPAFGPVAASVPGGTKPADWPAHPLWHQAEQAERSGDHAGAEALYLKLAAEMNQSGGDPDLANLCYARVHAVREKQRAAQRSATPADTGRRDLPPPAGSWIGPGALRIAGFRIESRPTYALVGPKSEVKCYAIAGPGVDLERFRGNEVELFGKVTYPGDLRGAGVVTVSRVQTARDR
jgi:hypothetical protein